MGAEGFCLTGYRIDSAFDHHKLDSGFFIKLKNWLPGPFRLMKRQLALYRLNIEIGLIVYYILEVVNPPILEQYHKNYS